MQPRRTGQSDCSSIRGEAGRERAHSDTRSTHLENGYAANHRRQLQAGLRAARRLVVVDQGAGDEGGGHWGGPVA